MTDRDPQYFSDLITELEKERVLWRQLHSMVFDLLKSKEEKHGDSYWVRWDEESDKINNKIATLPLHDNWYLSIEPYGNTPEWPIHNRWGQILSRPIEISLYLLQDDEARHDSEDISDNAKVTIIASPVGVVNLDTKVQLTPDEVLAVINDIERAIQKEK